MLAAIQQYLRVAQFKAAAQNIIQCPPVACDATQPLILVSQLRQRDIFMYLLALKSFTRYVSPSKVVVLDDGSLSPPEHELLKRQIPGVEIRSIGSIETGPCPRGGTWERLLHILDCSQHSYVIQLDADTVSLHDLTEVRQCVAENRSFTLGTPNGREFVSFKAASEFAVNQLPNGQHVQILAERALARFPVSEGFRYVRGNSGFAGFARGAFSRSKLEDFSRTMAGLLGEEKWREWGSEQVSSNFAIANSAAAFILPQPRYAFFKPDLNVQEAAFLHFIGTYRYRDGVYAKLARETITHLQVLAS